MPSTPHLPPREDCAVHRLPPCPRAFPGVGYSQSDTSLSLAVRPVSGWTLDSIVTLFGPSFLTPLAWLFSVKTAGNGFSSKLAQNRWVRSLGGQREVWEPLEN